MNKRDVFFESQSAEVFLTLIFMKKSRWVAHSSRSKTKRGGFCQNDCTALMLFCQAIFLQFRFVFKQFKNNSFSNYYSPKLLLFWCSWLGVTMEKMTKNDNNNRYTQKLRAALRIVYAISNRLYDQLIFTGYCPQLQYDSF